MSDLARPWRPPAILSYAERERPTETGFDRAGQKLIGMVKAKGARRRARGLTGIVARTAAAGADLGSLTDAELQARARALRPDLLRAFGSDRLRAADVAPAFAIIREAAGRVAGTPHYDVQLQGAFALLQGMIAEMRTGEGKTLCATLASVTAALAGEQVHVITVNDYLAKRDCEELTPLYAFFGLSTGLIQPGQDLAARRAAYACDITHGSNKEIAFDYLRDRMVLGADRNNLRHKLGHLTHSGGPEQLRLRGLPFAIVDEADSVLIDEARTPLIISGEVAESRFSSQDLFETAMAAAQALAEPRDYTVDHNERRLELTEAGKDRLEDRAEGEDSAFAVQVIREHAVKQALSALHLFREGEDYILRDGKVQIVDENTGRVMEDRSWSEGLHQMIELKEGVEVTAPRETLARITYQRFFRRYRRLGGMTGTATDSAAEFWAVYRLAVAKIPGNCPDIRRFAPPRIHAGEDLKWQAICARVAGLHKAGIPVLVGTRSVVASERVSAMLTEQGLPHQVLNADQTAQEAGIVAAAGQIGAITVATNMAGRGTDIKLGKGVAERGGLHVILSERHDSRRVDRQLEGRCGRQGDPGRVEIHLSLEDALLRTKSARLARGAARLSLGLSATMTSAIFRARQMRMERVHARMREDLLRADRNLAKMLAVTGVLE